MASYDARVLDRVHGKSKTEEVLVRLTLSIAAILLGLLLAPPASALSVQINATDAGWYGYDGVNSWHDPNVSNYLASCWTLPDYRNFFVFDLGGLYPVDQVQSGDLVVYTWDILNSPLSTYALKEVTTPVSTLRAGGSPDPGLLPIYTDLGDGTAFGSFVYSILDSQQWITIPLLPDALLDIESNAGAYWAVGGSSACNGSIFNSSSYIAQPPRLELQVATPCGNGVDDDFDGWVDLDDPGCFGSNDRSEFHPQIGNLLVAESGTLNSVVVVNGAGDESVAFSEENGDLVGVTDWDVPDSVTVSSSGLYVYVADNGLDDLFQVRWLYGWRQPVPWLSGPAYVNVAMVDLDPSGSLLVLDQGIPGVVHVQGSIRTLLSGPGAGSGPAFTDPRSMTVSEDGRIFVGETVTGSIYEVDPVSGDRTIVSSGAVGGGPAFGIIRDLAVHDGTLWVSDSGLPGVLEVDLASGDRTVVSSNSVGAGPAFVTPRGIVARVNRVTGSVELLVSDHGTSEILAIDAATGDRTTFSSGPALDKPTGLHLVTSPLANGTILVADNVRDHVLQIDGTTRRSRSGGLVGKGPAFAGVDAVLFESSDSLVVVDNGLDQVFRVDAATGDRLLLSGGGTGSGPAFGNLMTGAIEDSGDVVVLDQGLPGLFRVDPTTGDRTILSASGFGTGPLWSDPRSLARRDDGALVVGDTPLGTLFLVDPTNGNRSEVSSPTLGDGPAFGVIRALTIDDSDGSIFVSDSGVPGVLRVDPATGDRTLVSGPGLGTGPAFSTPRGIALDGLGRLLVGDQDLDAVLQVDPVTGNRLSLGGLGPSTQGPAGLAVVPGHCDDGADNDGDGLVDAADPGCRGPNDADEREYDLTCDDGADNDLDGLPDFWDPGCASPSDATETDPSLPCDDGIDNDGDGWIDRQDPQCASSADPNGESACSNGLDDDADGSIDYPDDPGCVDAIDDDERESTLPCDNGLDDDGDGRADFDPVTFADAPDFLAGTGDPGCARPDWPLEDPQCQDGVNNDSGPRIDFDGGQSIHGQCTGVPGGCPPGVTDTDGDGVADPDDQCVGRPWKDKEKKECGLGPELAVLLPLLMGLRRRRAVTRRAAFQRG